MHDQFVELWRGTDGTVESAPACPKCPSRLLLGGTTDRPFWVCPECHMAFLSPALMGHPEASIAARP